MTSQKKFNKVADGMEIKICDGPGCDRPGKLVQQFVAKCRGLDPFVFRTYFCQWHLGAQNRYRLNNQHRLFPIEYKTDAEVFKQDK